MSEAFVAPAGIARLSADWPSPSANAPCAGSLVRIADRGMVWSRLGSGGFQLHESKLALEYHPPLSWKDFSHLMQFYFAGHAPVPNARPIDDAVGLDAIACGGSLVPYANVVHLRLPHTPKNSWGGWSRAFLRHTQGGAFEGRGYAIAYRGARMNEGPKPFHRVYSFALCDHEVRIGRGARPTRGWHPASCSRCGIDLTVDSGD